jgi:tripartite-type tricarboxylate transporter receptor subunit TctC
MTGELFKMEAGIKMVHVPYRGEALALADLLGNQVQVVFPSLAASIGYARAGQVRLLGVTAATRSQIVPEIPTIAETIPGYESSTWYGVAAPTNTPPAVVERLSNAVNAALADPAFQAKIADLGGRTVPGSPSDFEKLIAEETEKWAKVVKFSGLRLE